MAQEKTSKKESQNQLQPIPFGERPKVLLVGNGINRSFPDAKEIKNIIQEEWEKNTWTELPKKICDMPFPLQVVVATQDSVQSCMEELSDAFKEMTVSPEQKKLISEILGVKFSAVLSTNYSLEFEKSAIEDYSERKVYSRYRTTKKPSWQQKELGIFQYTELGDENHTPLWHIHGTALRKNSMIMGQFYYGKLLTEVISRSNEVNRKYRFGENRKAPFLPESWIDYFLLGDVYILGFGVDFAESDIWWLLSYKKSAFPDTKVVLFEPGKIDDEKLCLLKCMKVETPKVKLFKKKDDPKNDDYIRYYQDVCREIKAGGAPSLK